MAMSFGEWLRQKRMEAGFTRAALAREAHVSAQYINKLEGGVAGEKPPRPSTAVVDRLATALDVPVSEARYAAGYWIPVDRVSALVQRATVMMTGLPVEKQQMLVDLISVLYERFKVEARGEEEEHDPTVLRVPKKAKSKRKAKR